jgi:hypothetical protein
MKSSSSNTSLNRPLADIFSGLKVSSYKGGKEDQSRIDSFITQHAASEKPLYASPANMNAIRVAYTKAKPEERAKVMQTTQFLADVKDLKAFAATMADRSLWGKIKAAGIESSAPPLSYDVSIIAQCVQFTMISKDQQHALTARFLETNLLSSDNVYDAHYLNTIPTVSSDMKSEQDFDGQNGSRYKGGKYDGKSYKFAENKYQPIVEACSIAIASSMGINTGSPKLVKVKQDSGDYVLGIRAGFIEGMSTIVPFETAKKMNAWGDSEEVKATRIEGKAEAKDLLTKFMTGKQGNINQLVSHLLHIVLTKNIDGFGRNFGNLQTDGKGTLTVLDAGSSFWFRALGQQKDLNPENAYGKDVAVDIVTLTDPKWNLSACVVVECIREHLKANPAQKDAIIQETNTMLDKLAINLPTIVKNSGMDKELADYTVEIVEARIKSLKANLSTIFDVQEKN